MAGLPDLLVLNAAQLAANHNLLVLGAGGSVDATTELEQFLIWLQAQPGWGAGGEGGGPHTHPMTDIVGLTAALEGKADDGHTHAYADITGKPTTFAPSAHTHLWAEITDPPATFTPSAHTHVVANVTDYVEATQDLVAAMLDPTHTGLTLAYNDTTGKITFTVTGGGGGATALGGLTDVVDSPAYTTGFTLRANGTAFVSARLDYTDLANVPSTFAPSTHSHAIADTTGLQTALDAKAPLASPTFTGTPAAPTATGGTNTTQIATTAFVTAGLAGKANTSHTHAQGDVTNLTTDLAAKAPLASPALTGTPTAPTATQGANSTQLATTAYVDAYRPIEHLMVPLSDETTAITTGTAKFTMRMPYAFTLVGLPRANLATVGSTLTTVDINEGGTSILGTKLTIDASEKTSTTAATPCTVTDTALADDAEITFDIDGAGTGAKGLKVTLIGRRA